MALTHFAFCALDILDPHYTQSEGAVVEGEAPSGTNAATTAVALGNHNYCRVATDTAVYVSFNAAPNAGTDASRFMMPANTVAFFRISPGYKGAVITI